MRLFHFGLACIAAMTTVPAMAVDVGSGTVQLGAGSAVQLGRLSRNGVQQDWTGTETYPGVINPTLSYTYATFTLPFAANAYQPIYYEINVDDEIADLFASAYLDSYDPTDLAANWLGDAGSSGNYFPGDPRYFDVVVPTGHRLVLVVNATAGTAPTSSADYLVTAFSDTEYGEDFLSAPVPEPATWTMMMLGFGATAFALRRRRTAKPRTTLAG